MSNIPFFEVNEQRYEVKRNRYLIAELEKLRKENSELSGEDEQNIVKLQDKSARLERLANRVKELEDKFYETFDEDDEAIYKRAKAHYDEMLDDLTKFEIEANGVIGKAQQAALGNAEKLLLIALQKGEKGETIRTYQEAEDIWCSFVDEVGTNTASEWLLYMVNYITGEYEEEENPFVTQAKAKAEQRANMKKGIAKVK